MWQLRAEAAEDECGGGEQGVEWDGMEYITASEQRGAMAVAMCDAAALRAADHACNN
jgi:hypothetical protein